MEPTSGSTGRPSMIDPRTGLPSAPAAPAAPIAPDVPASASTQTATATTAGTGSAGGVAPAAGPAPRRGADSLVSRIDAVARASGPAEYRDAVDRLARTPPTPDNVALMFETLRVASDPNVIAAIGQALGRLELANLPLVVAERYGAAGTAQERQRLLDVLRQAQQPGSEAALAELIRRKGGDYADPLAHAALDTLGAVGTPTAVADLLGLIEAAAQTGRDPAPPADALALTRGADSLPLLAITATGLTEASPGARFAAVRALGNYEHIRAREALQQVLAKETDPAIRDAARKALERASGRPPADFTGY